MVHFHSYVSHYQRVMVDTLHQAEFSREEQRLDELQAMVVTCCNGDCLEVSLTGGPNLKMGVKAYQASRCSAPKYSKIISKACFFVFL